MEKIKKLILIVEDERPLQGALEEKLQLSEYDTITASDGEKGLNVALEKKPDLILLDMLMPKMDGVSMLKELRKDEWGKTANVIVLTNVGNDTSKMADVVEQEVTEYLVKTNVSLEEIVTKIKQKLHAQ